MHTTRTLVVSPWLIGIVTVSSAGFLLIIALLSGASLLECLRWLDSGICSQLATHSFKAGSDLLPLCARNTGIYLGFFTTLVSLYAMRRGRAQRLPTKSVTAIFICGIATLVIDGFNSLFLDLGFPHLYQPDNPLRLATGLISGLALAVYVLPLCNRLCWKNTNQDRSIASWRDLLRFLPALLLAFLVVVAQARSMFYPIALLSTLGLLTAVSSFNFALILIVSRRDETFSSYRHIVPFFGLALILTIGELLVLAQLKILVVQALGV